MKKRVTSFLLSFLMILALLPVSHVHAETNSESAASALGASKYNRTWSGDFWELRSILLSIIYSKIAPYLILGKEF